jgi:hypothetical protein
LCLEIEKIVREKWADFMNDFGQCEQRGEGVNANFHFVNGIMGMIYVYEIIIKLYISYKFKVIWVVTRIIDTSVNPVHNAQVCYSTMFG